MVIYFIPPKHITKFMAPPMGLVTCVFNIFNEFNIGAGDSVAPQVRAGLLALDCLG